MRVIPFVVLRPLLGACLALIALPSTHKAAGELQRFTSSDGELQILAPFDWERVELHAPGAQIEAANNAKHLYFVVSSIKKSDVSGTLENYANRDLEASTRKLQDVAISEPREFETNRNEYIEYQLHGMSPRYQIRLAYLLTFVETEKHFVKIAAWTTESRFQSSVGQLSHISQSVSDVSAASRQYVY